MTSPVPRCVLALLVATLGAALLGWWWVGELSYTGDAGAQGLDYFLRAPELSLTALRLLAAAGAVLLLTAGAVLATTVPASARLRWGMLLAGAVVLGLALAYGGRAMTAGVIGANIGAGIVLLLGAPLLGLFTLLLVVVAVRGRRGLAG